MADPIDVQALSKISSEVDESQTKIILSNQCLKAQRFLFDKLRKQTETQKDVLKHIQNSNSKLEIEIKNAEEEIKSLLLAISTVKSANVELKKELLMSKEYKKEIIDRVRNGEKKYEVLWSQCKSRYERLPYVQKLLESNNKLQSLKDKIDILQNNSNSLSEEIEIKKNEVLKCDQDRIVELAKFIVIELPNTLKLFKEKSEDISKLKYEIEEFSKARDRQSVIVKPRVHQDVEEKTIHQVTELNEHWPNLHNNLNDDSLMMPQLHLRNFDFDMLSAKLDKIKKTDLSCSPLKRSEPIVPDRVNIVKKPLFDNKSNDYFSSYFKESLDDIEDAHNKDYSRKKLINILEDLELDDKDTFKIISKVNPDKFENVEEIKAVKEMNAQKIVDEEKGDTRTVGSQNEVNKAVESEVIEELDLTKGSENNILPPSPFMDLTQEKSSKTQSQSSQGRYSQLVEVMVHKSMDGSAEKQVINKEGEVKKRVSFDLTNTLKEISHETPQIEDKNETCESDGQLNISSVSDQSFINVKNMILKEHKLDLSPTFVYSKNYLNKNTEEQKQGNITSKFFPRQSKIDGAKEQGGVHIVEVKDQVLEQKIQIEDLSELNNDEVVEMKADDVVASSSPKSGGDHLVSGLLFSHGAGGAVPDSLDMSASTAPYDDQDNDYQHCIDSSVLLSPKADLSMPSGAENVEEVTSQEVPNFLSGLRRTGLSFFGMRALDSNQDAGQSQAGFNFNFGGSGEEKKNRGGLFNMFR